jgi:predicted AlkP superfamily phosphohydrolase/phosphomutase
MLARSAASAALAASLLAADLVLLTLFLNPEATLRRDGLGLLLSLFLPYLVLGTAAFTVLALLGAVVRGWPRAPRPPIEGLPGFTTLTFLALAASTALFWVNLLAYRHSVPPEALRGLLASSLALSGGLLVLLAVGVDAVLFPLRSRGISAALVVLAAASAVVVPLALRPQPLPVPPPLPVATETVLPARRVILIGLDGLGPEQVRDGISRGVLPELAELVRRGAYGPLATLRPTEAPPVWTTVFTGRLPRDHGVKSFRIYRLRGSPSVFEALPKGAFVRLLERVRLVTTTPVTATSRRRRALWNTLNAFGISTGVVRFWGTHPPERVQGFMLSPSFHLLQADPQRARESLYPPDLLPEVRARVVEPKDVSEALLSEFVDSSVAEDDLPWRRDLVERALAPDLTYQRAGEVLRAAYDPPFFATYVYGLDVVGHTFTRFARPDHFGDVRPEAARRYGRVWDRYTALLSRQAGEIAQKLRPGEVLVVVSGFGMEPLPLWRRIWEAALGNPHVSGGHAGAPDGFLLAVGDGIRPGARLGQASVLDLAPTLLYLMGLPVARDMDGRVLTEMLEESVTRGQPVTYIPSYESLAVTPTTRQAGPDLPPLPGDDEP